MAEHRTPSHLSEGSQTWLAGLRDSTDEEGQPLRRFTATEWRILLLAAEAWDRAQTARRTMTREGLTVTAPILSKKGEVVGERITAHPAAGIARDNSTLFSRLVAQLGLDTPAPRLGEEEPDKDGEEQPGGILLRLAQRTG